MQPHLSRCRKLQRRAGMQEPQRRTGHAKRRCFLSASVSHHSCRSQEAFGSGTWKVDTVDPTQQPPQAPSQLGGPPFDARSSVNHRRGRTTDSAWQAVGSWRLRRPGPWQVAFASILRKPPPTRRQKRSRNAKKRNARGCKRCQSSKFDAAVFHNVLPSQNDLTQ